jgi:hypothetical protein
MFLLWPEGMQHDDLLFVTDTAPYILKAGKSIKSFYTKLVFVTCPARALHIVTFLGIFSVFFCHFMGHLSGFFRHFKNSFRSSSH